MKTLTKVSKGKKGLPVNIKTLIDRKPIFITGIHGETMDYTLFTNLEYNRGFKTSINPDIITKFENDIENKEYMDEGTDALVNKYGDIIDHHHHAYLRMKQGLSIRYYVTTTGKANVDNVDKLTDFVSYYNSHTSKHTKNNIYQQALGLKRPLAKTFLKVKKQIGLESDLKMNKIQHSWIYSLLNANHKYFNSSTELDKLCNYSNKEYNNYVLTNKFKKDLSIFIRLTNELLKTGAKSRFYKVIGLILKLHWSQPLFDVNKLIDRISTNGFKADAYNTLSPIQKEIERLYNFGTSKNYIQLFKDKKDSKYTNITKSYNHTY